MMATIHVFDLPGEVWHELPAVGAFAYSETDYNKLKDQSPFAGTGYRASVLVADDASIIEWYDLGLVGPLAFAGLTSLEQLIVHYNPLLTVPPVLTGLTSLTLLRLNNNQLAAPPILTGLTALVDLRLYQNPLTTPPDISGLALLIAVDLSHMQLTSSGVDQVLAQLVANAAEDGVVTLDGQTPSAPPGAQGLLDKATLESLGWTVFVDA